MSEVLCPYCGSVMKRLDKKSTNGTTNIQFYCTKCKAKSPMAKDIDNAEWLSMDGARWVKEVKQAKGIENDC